jgi:hypothetical protein
MSGSTARRYAWVSTLGESTFAKCSFSSVGVLMGRASDFPKRSNNSRVYLSCDRAIQPEQQSHVTCMPRLLRRERVTETGKTTSKDADNKFKKGINALITNEKKFHSKEIVAEKMKKTGAYDKSYSTILNRLKENFHVREYLAPFFRRPLIPIFSRW